MSGQENKACVAGVKQTRKAILNGTAGSVLLAENADPERQVDVQWVPSMKELGRMCSLSVGAAAAAVLS